MEKGEWFQLGERVVIGAGLAAVSIFLLGLSWDGAAWRWMNLAICGVFTLMALTIVIAGVVELMKRGGSLDTSVAHACSLVRSGLWGLASLTHTTRICCSTKAFSILTAVCCS